MKQVLKASILVISISSLVSCSSLSNQDVGVLTGGVAGGLLGSQFGGGTGRLVMTGVGTLAGGIIGGAIGRNMDETDKLKTQRALENLPTGKTQSWHNPDTGNNYRVKPVKTFTSSQGAPCREYIMNANIGGKTQQTYGTACRQADGSWKIKN